MRHNSVIQSSGATLTLLALGWIGLTAALMEGLQPAEMHLILGVVVTAECLSALIHAFSLPNARRISTQDVLGRVLIGWVTACILLAALWQLQLLPLFSGHGFAVLCLLGMTLVLSLLKHVGASGRGIMLSLRLAVSGFALALVQHFGTLTLDTALGVMILCHLLLLSMMMLMSSGSRAVSIEASAPNMVSVTLARYADLLVVPLVLIGGDALVYLVARALVEVIWSGLSYLGQRTLPNLTVAFEQGKRADFIGLAARLNLGVLLVGGGLCLGALAAGPYLAKSMDVALAKFENVLTWLTLGAAAPLLFGATTPILYAARMQILLVFIPMAGTAVLWTAVVFTTTPTALFLAQATALVHLMSAAVSAVILARTAGVWPGLTALMLRQIKLF